MEKFLCSRSVRLLWLFVAHIQLDRLMIGKISAIKHGRHIFPDQDVQGCDKTPVSEHRLITDPSYTIGMFWCINVLSKSNARNPFLDGLDPLAMFLLEFHFSRLRGTSQLHAGTCRAAVPSESHNPGANLAWALLFGFLGPFWGAAALRPHWINVSVTHGLCAQRPN